MQIPPVVRVQTAPVAVAEECARLAGDGEIGAAAVFVGSVRGGEVKKMFLEHYPGMTEKALGEIAAAAGARWPLLRAHIVHRVGELLPGEAIVFVGACAAHRAAAFAACEYMTDHLKTRAPFWKKETRAGGEQWVAAADADETALARWQK